MTLAQIVLVFVGVMAARGAVLLPEWANLRHRDFWIDLALLVLGYAAIFWAVQL